MSKLLKENVLGLSIVLASFACVVAFYPRIPDPVPIQWSMHGVPKGWAPKPWGAFILPLTTAGLFVLFLVLPKISPREKPIASFSQVYRHITNAVLGTLLAITVAATLAATGVRLDMGRVVPLFVGVLLLVLGGLLAQVAPNYFVGIRTPWTLENEEVWRRTNRLGGKLLVVAGLATAVAAAFGAGTQVLLASVLGATLIAVLYSYVAYRRLAPR